jgi:dynactin complex subunit
MEGISKEYFDEHMSALTRNISAIKETMTTKDDLQKTEARLKDHAKELQAELAGMIERTINVSGRVEGLEHDVAAIKQALHM